MTDETVQFSSELFVWGEGNWYFVLLPVEAAEELRDIAIGPPRGFGSIRVDVQVGESAWKTSVFPAKESGSFLLPMKKAIRKAEDLEDGDQVEVTLSVQAD